jgi:hypothetical protein
LVCKIAILAIIVVVIVAATLIYLPIWEVKRTEQTLNDRYGEAVAFVPSQDGSVPPEKVEAFLRVRKEVFGLCPEFRDRITEVIRLERLEGDESVPRAVAAWNGIDGFKRLLGFGPLFLDFMDTRNSALLNEQMGLGEYFYIYVLAYIEQLRRAKETIPEEFEMAYVGPRAQKELIQILKNQLESLTPGADRPTDTKLAASLRDQITRLSEGRQSLPWEDGLPPAIAASLEPYAEHLVQLYCEGIAKIELMQKNKGLNLKN